MSADLDELAARIDQEVRAYPPRHTNPPRPYARKQKYGASVTTVLGSLGGGDGLMWGAANETAAFAVDYPDQWQHLERDVAWDRVRKHFRGLWDGRAAMGTVVHAVNEEWTWARDVDLDALVVRIAEGVPTWHGRERFVADEADGYIDGLAAFWADFAPDTIGTEEIVRYAAKGGHAYIGTRDWTARLDGLDGVTLLDIKTTAQKDADKGLYFDKFRLQLAAYRYAKEIVRFDGGDIVETWPNYAVDRCCILHLRGDGKYQLFECQAAGDEWATFLRLIDLHRWSTVGHRKPEPVDRTIYRVTEEKVA